MAQRTLDIREGRRAPFEPKPGEVKDWVLRPAKWEERKAIHAVAKLSSYTKKWDQVYYLQKYFEREALGVCVSNGEIVGFIMVHHLIRKPYSSLYYAGVSARRKGVATALVRWAWMCSPHPEYRLTVDEDNVAAQAFWAKCGFVKYGQKTVKDGHTVFEMKCSRERAEKRGLTK